MIFGPSGWPSRWAWKAAAVMTLLTLPLALLGSVGRVIFIVVVVVVVFAIVANQRFRSVDPDEEFRNSRPPE